MVLHTLGKGETQVQFLLGAPGQLSKCGHCGGLKIRGTWFDPGSWHQIM